MSAIFVLNFSPRSGKGLGGRFRLLSCRRMRQEMTPAAGKPGKDLSAAVFDARGLPE
jgi:hypothetical protein